MVLRCPRCSTLKFFGRPQVLGELVVCPKCEMVFRWGDARPGKAEADHPVRVEYSIDGGKSYSARPTIAVVQDGKSVEQPAPRERYTHVRWTVLGSLAAGAKVMAEFRTQISEAPSVK